jgi:hypothetical protein
VVGEIEMPINTWEQNGMTDAGPLPKDWSTSFEPVTFVFPEPYEPIVQMSAEDVLKRIADLLEKAEALPKTNYEEVIISTRDALANAIFYQHQVIAGLIHSDGTPRPSGWE